MFLKIESIYLPNVIVSVLTLPDTLTEDLSVTCSMFPPLPPALVL